MVVFDTWAWWEVLHATPTGEQLAKEYLMAVDVRLLTPDLALAEISARLAREGRADEIARALNVMERASEVVPITRKAAEACGALLGKLRQTDRNAGLADSVMLAIAREEGAVLISGDRCFRGERDVRDD